MRRIRIGTLILATALAVVMAACGGKSGSKATATTTTSAAGASATASPPSGPPIQVGVSTDLTGPTSYLGTAELAGLQTYIDYLNRNGGVNGRPIKLTVLDNRFNATTTVNQYRELVSNHVLFVTGLEGSVAASASAPLAVESKTAAIPQAYVSKFHTQPQPYLFALDMSPVVSAKLQMAFVQQLAQKANIAAPRISAYSIDTPAAQEYREAIQAEARSRGWTVVDMEQIPLASTDVSAQASKTAAAKPDFVVSLLLDPQLSLVVPALRQAGVSTPVVEGFYGNESETFAHINDGQAYAIRDIVPIVKDSDVPAVKTMLERAQAAGLAPKQDLYMFGLGYISGMVFENALKKCGADCTPEKFNTALESVGTVDTAGLSGPVSFSATKHYLVSYGRPYRWDPQSGRLVAVGDWATASP